MHPLLATEILDVCRKMFRAPDYPPVDLPSKETLADCICELGRRAAIDAALKGTPGSNQI